jgi:predicted site-specific integrase-resolvase
MHDRDVMVTERAAAAYLGVSVAALRRWRRLGRPPAWAKLGEKLIRYRAADLERFVAASTCGVGREAA